MGRGGAVPREVLAARAIWAEDPRRSRWQRLCQVCDGVLGPGGQRSALRMNGTLDLDPDHGGRFLLFGRSSFSGPGGAQTMIGAYATLEAALAICNGYIRYYTQITHLFDLDDPDGPRELHVRAHASLASIPARAELPSEELQARWKAVCAKRSYPPGRAQPFKRFMLVIQPAGKRARAVRVRESDIESAVAGLVSETSRFHALHDLYADTPEELVSVRTWCEATAFDGDARSPHIAL